VDDFTRECVAIEVDRSLPGARVIRVLDRPQAFVESFNGKFRDECLNEPPVAVEIARGYTEEPDAVRVAN
jgi:hypothetical protein